MRYPGLATHPQHGVADRLFRDGLFGSLVTMDILGGRPGGMAFCDALRAVRIAPGQVRLSVGVEDPGELLVDLRQALDAVAMLDGHGHRLV